jgi:hypothetical protein
MDVEVTALMSADDEALWKRAGIFNSVDEYTAPQSVKGSFHSSRDPRSSRSLPNLPEGGALAPEHVSFAKSPQNSCELPSVKKKRLFQQFDEFTGRREVQNAFTGGETGSPEAVEGKQDEEEICFGF